MYLALQNTTSAGIYSPRSSNWMREPEAGGKMLNGPWHSTNEKNTLSYTNQAELDLLSSMSSHTEPCNQEAMTQD